MINDGLMTYNSNNGIKFKISMLKSSLCDYSDAHTLAKRIITITGQEVYDAEIQTDERIKAVIFKNCTPFTDCISKLNNIQVDNNAKELYNVIEYIPVYNIIWYFYTG